MVFVADDLAAWLIGLLADTGRKKLTTLVLGTDQERELRHAATVAVELTAAQLAPSGGGQPEQLAMVVSEVFRGPGPDVALARHTTVFEALEAGIVEKLAVLDDPLLTGTGQSSAGLLGVSGGVLTETLVGHLVREIVFRGSRGGPLTPLADQLNHDLTHLQGQRLEGMLAHLTDQVAALARAGSATAMQRKPVRLLPRPTLLVGRRELLAELDIRLATGDDPWPRTVVLCGLGGTGKTSVALEYSHRHLAAVGVAWQLAAENAIVLAAGFGQLAAQLGVGDDPDSGDPVASVHAVLAAFPDQWLLVFDNAPDRASVEGFLPPAGRGRLLITSQHQHWPHAQSLQVPVLSTEVAGEFLVNRTGDPDERVAKDLAAELGGLPLALEQAAAYIQATGTSLVGYLSIFRDRRADLLARGEAAGHPADVAATLGLALSRLGGEAPAAAGLARLLACLAPEPVPLALLLADPQTVDMLALEVTVTLGPLLGDPVAVGDAVAALRHYSLVTPAGDSQVLMHRLVQTVALSHMPMDVAGQWGQAAAALIEAAVPADTDLPSAWPVCAVLLPHVRAVLDLTSGGMSRIACYLGFSGSYPAARDLFQLIADAYGKDEAYGPEHRHSLAARRELAKWTGLAGDVAGARDQLAALLPIHEEVLGPEHPGTLEARGHLAYYTGVSGDAAGARDYFAALRPITERVLGAEHQDTLDVRANLARWTGEAGDAAGARDQYAALLPVFEQALGPENPGTMITRENLAYYTGVSGDAAGARDQLAALLPIAEQVLGPAHPDTLDARFNLARWTGEAGDAAAARDQYAALVPITERVQGAEHPDTLMARGSLARWTGKAGDTAGARDQLAALLPVAERVLGTEHPDTLDDRGGLARWTGEAGDAAGARDQLAALLPITERVRGPEHPDTLADRGGLARWTGEAGDAAAARDQYAALVPITERVQGAEHPDTLADRGGLARWTGEAGDAAAARDQYAALLPITERVQGAEHPDTLMARGSLARWTGEAGDAAAARDQYAALLPITERVQGAEHPDTLADRSNLAHWAEQAIHGRN